MRDVRRDRRMVAAGVALAMSAAACSSGAIADRPSAASESIDAAAVAFVESVDSIEEATGDAEAGVVDEGPTTAVVIDESETDADGAGLPFPDEDPNPAAVSEIAESGIAGDDGAGSDDSGDITELTATDGADDDADVDGPTTIGFDVSGLVPLDCDLVYQAWLVVDGAGVLLGSFDIGIDGSPVDPVHGGPVTFRTDVEDPEGVVISIEDPADESLTPSLSRIMAGPFDDDGFATLSTDNVAALDIDLSEVAGSFILATPTNGLPDSDELSGIWFETSDLEPSLTLPELPSGWIYEGWVVIDGRPLSIGQFTAGDEADDFSGFSATEFPAPEVPGEDFVENAPDDLEFPLSLAGATVLVTIEAEADDNAKPFNLVVLSGVVPDDAEPFVDIPLEAASIDIVGAALLGADVSVEDLADEADEPVESDEPAEATDTTAADAEETGADADADESDADAEITNADDLDSAGEDEGLGAPTSAPEPSDEDSEKKD